MLRLEYRVYISVRSEDGYIARQWNGVVCEAITDDGDRRGLCSMAQGPSRLDIPKIVHALRTKNSNRRRQQRDAKVGRLTVEVRPEEIG